MDVLNRTTRQFLRSVNEPDYPKSEWIWEPDLGAVTGIDSKYWVVAGDVVSLMKQADRDEVDATLAAQAVATDRAEQKARLDSERLLKGMVLWVRDELNELRAKHSLPPLTAKEIKAAIKGHVDTV